MIRKIVNVLLSLLAIFDFLGIATIITALLDIFHSDIIYILLGVLFILFFGIAYTITDMFTWKLDNDK